MNKPQDPAETVPPPPRNVSWHRFANLVISYNRLVDSYLAAGFTCSRNSAYSRASKLRKKPEVAAYIDHWQAVDYAARCANFIREQGE